MRKKKKKKTLKPSSTAVKAWRRGEEGKRRGVRPGAACRMEGRPCAEGKGGARARLGGRKTVGSDAMGQRLVGG